jgi:hypothetical protein
VNSTFYFAQDTISGSSQGQANSSLAPQDSSTGLKKFSTSEVDDIFKAMERKERQLDSIARVRAYRAYLRSIESEKPEPFDTSAVPYNLLQDSISPGSNPLSSFKIRYYSSKDTLKPVLHEAENSSETMEVVRIIPQAHSPGGHSHDLRPDWLIAIVIGSLVLLAWLKLFYNKFLDQTLQSLTNYQLSSKLLRDQNMFSRRVAFALNINFVIVGGAFLYLVLGFFNIRIFSLGDFPSFLAYTGILSLLLILRYFISHIVGHVFRRQGEFREYLHQLLLIHKNLGIYLLIPVAGISYIREDMRIYLVYLSVLFILFALVLRLVKGIKIVLNNKDVLIFYLILYLCTLEILPLLIFYRFFSSSVQAG